MKNSTLIFLIKKENNKNKEICLAVKKRRYGVGKWNGVGGKPEDGDKDIEDTAIREAREEINVEVNSILKVAELTFVNLYNHEYDQLVHAYLCYDWQGEPKETEEMSPRWFDINEIPFADMWPDDEFWLPKVLKGYFITGKFEFLDENTIQEFSMNGKLL